MQHSNQLVGSGGSSGGFTVAPPGKSACSSSQAPYRGYNLGYILTDPGFHVMNVYAIVMRTLARFEYALGRRVARRVEGHQLKVLPYGFAAANAFYTPDAESHSSDARSARTR